MCQKTCHSISPSVTVLQLVFLTGGGIGVFRFSLWISSGTKEVSVGNFQRILNEMVIIEGQGLDTNLKSLQLLEIAGL